MASETVGQIIQMIFTLGHATCLDMVNGLNASFERVDGEKEKKSRSKGGKKRMEFFNIQRELVKSAYQYNTHWHAKKTNGKDGFMMSTDKVAQNILKTMPNLAIATTTIKDEINRIRGAEKS